MDQTQHPRTTTSPALTPLADPLVNKGTAFSRQERAELGLDGLLPPAVETLDEQVARAYEAFHGYDKPLNRHIYLRQLQDTNEVLFYRLVTEYLEELLPVVYTPTVGEACQRFSEIYRRPRGLFLTWEDRHRFRDILRNRPHRDKDVDVIVVTDGQRILGLGDQGVGGMGIPIGKLSLYTAIGGIHPARTLPILLDVGTDNEDLLGNPRYLGRRARRLTGADYDEMIEAFVSAVEAELPGTLLQWEDFATAHAYPILARYRDRLLTFNDDIQGTAAVTLGALSTAANVSGTPLSEQRLVTLGAGSAAIGVADMIRTAMIEEGLSEDEASATACRHLGTATAAARVADGSLHARTGRELGMFDHRGDGLRRNGWRAPSARRAGAVPRDGALSLATLRAPSSRSRAPGRRRRRPSATWWRTPPPSRPRTGSVPSG
ncbi:NAD-dependent malic enzyme [Streptomyces violarus]